MVPIKLSEADRGRMRSSESAFQVVNMPIPKPADMMLVSAAQSLSPNSQFGLLVRLFDVIHREQGSPLLVDDAQATFSQISIQELQSKIGVRMPPAE